MIEFPKPTLKHLGFFADLSGYNKWTMDEYITVQDPKCVGYRCTATYEPASNAEQSFRLLEKVIYDCDCELFSDSDCEEYYIYKYKCGGEKEILSAGPDLKQVILESAMILWFEKYVNKELKKVAKNAN